MSALLDVKNLTLQFRTDEGLITAVEDVSFSLNKGEVMGLVGESGSGKSVTAKALMHLNARNAVYGPDSRITLHTEQGEVDVLSLRTPRDLKVVRGGAISMIFQDPITSLDPVFTIGSVLQEVIRSHRNVSRTEAREIAVGALVEAELPDAADRLDSYPHQLSGGMRQRVMIALAVALDPKLLIADEPTTALDVTVQAQIL